MIIVAGLGNPGDEYKKTRHNAGRIILEAIASKENFSDWREDKKSRALVSGGKAGTVKSLFVLPNNFMNNSGGSVKPNIPTAKDREKLVVVYDDLDLPIGALRSKAFMRVRVGISPHTPGGKTKKPAGEKAVLDFLLKNFKEEELKEIKKISKKVSEALECFGTEGKEVMMNKFNTN